MPEQGNGLAFVLVFGFVSQLANPISQSKRSTDCRYPVNEMGMKLIEILNEI